MAGQMGRFNRGRFGKSYQESAEYSNVTINALGEVL